MPEEKLEAGQKMTGGSANKREDILQAAIGVMCRNGYKQRFP